MISNLTRGDSLTADKGKFSCDDADMASLPPNFQYRINISGSGLNKYTGTIAFNDSIPAS